MDLILCHVTADFDTLGAAVGLSRLQPGARIVLTGGSHPTVREFLALHRDEYPLIERRSVSTHQIRSISVVDTQCRDRLGKAAEWLDLPDMAIAVYDHHLSTTGDITATQTVVEPVGATTTLMVEQLRAQQIDLTLAEATVMALGIHVDTGSLTFDHTTVRDAAALTWLMEQGASLRAIAEYVEPGLSPQLQDLLSIAMETLQAETVQGLTLAWVQLTVDEYVQGLSSLAGRLISLTESDVLLLAAVYPSGEAGVDRLSIIGRSRSRSPSIAQSQEINLGKLLKPLGGGGHAKAAAATLRTADPTAVLTQLLTELRQQIPPPLTARELMSSPVRTIRPETTIAEAERILLRYGHSGLSVVDEQDLLVGIISRRDLDIALHHGFRHAPVKGYMTSMLKTIAPDTTLSEIEALMVTYDIGRLPVLENEQLVGIVTRTDVLRQLHQEKVSRLQERLGTTPETYAFCLLPRVMQQMLRKRLAPALWDILITAATQAEHRGWQLYVVGGAVRDLLLAAPEDSPLEDSALEDAALEDSLHLNGLHLDDLDLVVDGFHRSADAAAGVELARALQQVYSAARLQIHGRFQTAALLWHHDSQLDSLWIDIATARTEFYPYPAANPEVEASSIRQDLYRRDFTVNALAIRLTSPQTGELLDYFGGLHDLKAKQIRVLHANSFIEDPTRIYRAVRFATRLGFEIEPQTEGYIRHAIASGIYDRVQLEMGKTPALQTRLRRELKYILEAQYWQPALRLLADLGALRCLHSNLELTDALWRKLRLVDRWLKRFDPQSTLEHWQVLLEVLIADLEPEERGRVAVNLQLPLDSIDRLQHLDQIQAAVQAAMPQAQRPSQIVQLLRPYDLPTLALVAVQSSRPLRQLIWQYFTCWAEAKPSLDGNDLKELGYQPGRQFKAILDRLLVATLDGEVSDRTQAQIFLAQHFPLERPEVEH
jgi:tRNA nucleotidyltransferase (CCA-adding enzyme)